MLLPMKKTLGLMLLFGCLGLFSGRELRADSVTTYDFSATLTNPLGFVGDTVSGQFTLDTTTGTASAYLTGATPNPLTVGAVYSWQNQSLYPNLVELQFFSSIDPFENIGLYYATSLNAFDPATFTTGPTGQGSSTIATDFSPSYGYVSSSLTNASTTTVAEPGSLYLILVGLAGIVVICKMVH